MKIFNAAFVRYFDSVIEASMVGVKPIDIEKNVFETPGFVNVVSIFWCLKKIRIPSQVMTSGIPEMYISSEKKFVSWDFLRELKGRVLEEK